jgi:hypothetical protein
MLVRTLVPSSYGLCKPTYKFRPLHGTQPNNTGLAFFKEVVRLQALPHRRHELVMKIL